MIAAYLYLSATIAFLFVVVYVILKRFDNANQKRYDKLQQEINKIHNGQARLISIAESSRSLEDENNSN